MTDTFGKWHVLRQLGEGGQGTVFLVRDSTKSDLWKIKNTVADSVREIMNPYKNDRIPDAERLIQGILDYGAATGDVNQGALKLLHTKKNEQEHAKQVDRMKLEVKALGELSHRNVIRILDQDIENGWFVSPYFPGGTLKDWPSLFRGDVLGALKAFKPIVEAVAQIHAHGRVHRDIKPANIFVGNSNSLVLGDLGLVFFEDEKHTRVSETYENVGSRDWMPAWAMGVRLDKVTPAFDVFALGKLLWSMVSGKTILQLWYHKESPFLLEEIFPDKTEIRWVQEVLNQTVVEREKDCLKDAGILLAVVDNILNAVSRHCEVLGEGAKRPCRVCGLGTYERGEFGRIGLQQTGTSKIAVFTCNQCGHLEIFEFARGGKPPAWQ